MTRERTPHQASVTDTVELLGLVAQLEDSAFDRHAADAANAPDAEGRLLHSRFAAQSVERRDRVLSRVTELGGDPVAAIAPYNTVLDDFDVRTQPSTWWERLLKGYVGAGVSDDFCRLAARNLDPVSRALVLDVLDDAAQAEMSVRSLENACAQDEVLTARLALWGRRVVGESLQIVQRLLVNHPGLARLMTHAEHQGPVAETDGQPALPVVEPATPAAPGKVLNELTAEHTRRMSRLKFTA
ncbi:MAG: ferritin-like domain-containing protein [Actinobacteria bacterium]|nr:ferritin-like domain-containing protein [Actinomycetota bacterium]MCG2803437.1 ferritin-like domain-containing protein [Cellulomonas sp.]